MLPLPTIGAEQASCTATAGGANLSDKSAFALVGVDTGHKQDCRR